VQPAELNATIRKGDASAAPQEASDIVIMDDNFSSIVKSVLWGRSVYDNIRRFLQFQMTVNVCALILCMVGSITGFGTPLKPIQLLWVNLIMDTLAALALATELPTPDMLLRKPYGRHDHLINGHMWRNLLVQALYQIIFLLVLLYAVPSKIMLHDCIPKGYYGQTSDCMALRPDGTGHIATENYRNTIIYNAFVWAQLFNEINSRKIYNELNAFDGVFTNSMFIGVLVSSAILQFISVQFIPAGFKTVPLDGDDWGISLILGAMAIPIGVLARFLPPFDFVNTVMGAIGGGGGDDNGEAKGGEAETKTAPQVGSFSRCFFSCPHSQQDPSPSTAFSIRISASQSQSGNNFYLCSSASDPFCLQGLSVQCSF
jgi:Ca2+-transporting ATPase